MHPYPSGRVARRKRFTACLVDSIGKPFLSRLIGIASAYAHALVPLQRTLALPTVGTAPGLMHHPPALAACGGTCRWARTHATIPAVVIAPLVRAFGVPSANRISIGMPRTS